MTPTRPRLAGVVLAGLAASAAALIAADSTPSQPPAWIAVAIGLFVIWSFIGVGLVAWRRRPDNRVGPLMIATGFAFTLTALVDANEPWVFAVGLLLGSLYLGVFVHMLLAYPDGRLGSVFTRRVALGAYALSLTGSLPYLLVGDIEDSMCPCPASPLKVSDSQTLLRWLEGLVALLAVLLLAALVVALVRRWRVVARSQRPAVAPVVWSGVALAVLVAASLATRSAGALAAADVLGVLGLAAFASVPWAFLVGLVRSRTARAGTMADLLIRLGEAAEHRTLRDILADALGDPTLQLAYWLEDRGRWVDVQGDPVSLPAEDDAGRAWTPVEHEGRRVGAIVHDRLLCEDRWLVRSVAAAAGLAVENERLQAQLRLRVVELRDSRARIVDAGMAERRRLERDLHDGAQQRLVALSLNLRLAQARLHRDPHAAEELLTGAQLELATALEELRELARGIHPAVLSDRGLDAALEALAGRSPVPVELKELPPERLPAAAEAAAYFVVAEALTNVAKYAEATHATVVVHRRNGHAVVEVADDGVGGADPDRGSGLHGLADRLAALDGRLEVESPHGAGTRLRAKIPV